MTERNPEHEAQQARAQAAWKAWDEAKETAPASPTPARAEPPPPATTASVAIAGTPPPRPRVDPTYAWTIALLPLVWIPLAYLAPAAASSWGVFGVWAATAGLAGLDSRRLREQGVMVSAWSVLLLIPVYLILRTKRAGSTPAIPVVWFASFGASILALTTFAAVYDFDGDYAEPQIEKWLRDQGVRNVNVDCPDTTTRVGGEIECSVTDASGRSVTVVVTMAEDGAYSWQVAG
jgi:hypothetical protein